GCELDGNQSVVLAPAAVDAHIEAAAPVQRRHARRAARLQPDRRHPTDAPPGVLYVESVRASAVPRGEIPPARLHPVVAGRSDGDGERRRDPDAVSRLSRPRVRGTAAGSPAHEDAEREVPAEEGTGPGHPASDRATAEA